jgi:hypothetical protein
MTCMLDSILEVLVWRLLIIQLENSETLNSNAFEGPDGPMPMFTVVESILKSVINEDLTML